MKEWKLFVDIDEDFNPEDAKELNLGLISMPVIINGEVTYPWVEGELKEFTFEEYYDRLRKGLVPKTSGLSPEKYTEYFKPYAEKGIDILYAHFSEAMSGTFNAMRIAVNEIKESHPDWRFEEVDTMAITGLSRAIILEVLPDYKAGKSLDEVKEKLEGLRQHYAITLFANDLKFFKASGRVSGIAAFVGGALGLKPIITIQEDGYMRPTSKAMGTKKAINAIVEDIKNKGDDVANHTVVLSHTGIAEIHRDYMKKILNEMGITNIDERVVSPVGGAHAGPDCMAVSFHAKHR